MVVDSKVYMIHGTPNSVEHAQGNADGATHGSSLSSSTPRKNEEGEGTLSFELRRRSSTQHAARRCAARGGVWRRGRAF